MSHELNLVEGYLAGRGAIPSYVERVAEVQRAGRYAPPDPAIPVRAITDDWFVGGGVRAEIGTTYTMRTSDAVGAIALGRAAAV